jgi:hypothetical protein
VQLREKRRDQKEEEEENELKWFVLSLLKK